MAIPKLEYPILSTTLPSNGQSIKYRPFLVKEEKMFLIATTTNDEKSKLDTLKEILKNCTFGEVDIGALPSFDLEHLFIKLRNASKGSNIQLMFTCNNEVVDEDGNVGECGNSISINYNLDLVKLKTHEDHDKKIMLSDTIGLTMKYPTMDTISSFNFDEADPIAIYDLIADMVDTVFDVSGEIYEMTREEMIEWFDEMEQIRFQKIKDFFETIPVNYIELDVRCPKCDYKTHIEMEGMDNFLDF